MLLRTTLAILVASTLAACAAEVKPPRVAVRYPVLTVESGHGHGGFGPPGQAKKGRC